MTTFQKHLSIALGRLLLQTGAGGHPFSPVFIRCYTCLTLQHKSSTHCCDAPEDYRIRVKVIDIPGNDTTKVMRVEVKQ